MARRLLFLGLLCAAVTLMMGLMVVEAESGLAPPRFGSYETPFLAPASACPRTDTYAAPEWSPQAPGAENAGISPVRAERAATPAVRKPPLLGHFEAFHLSDRAG
jgi:hypothetical protein